MGLAKLLFSDPSLFFLLVGLLLYSVIFHEVAHGAVALLFGDDTALRSGRLTLNPLPHIDPVGALLLLLAGFGWARPVPVNFRRLSPAGFGIFCVALAGVAVNILIAATALFLMQAGIGKSHALFFSALPILAKINLILAAFNLIPLPPLDGSKIVMAFLPPAAQRVFARLEPLSFVLLIVLVMTGRLEPAILFFEKAILALIGLVFTSFR